MLVRYFITLLALAGLALAISRALDSGTPQPMALPVADPASPPFASYVAGSGIVEASSRNIAVGTPVAGVVERVHVEPGDRVKAGDPLFRLDERELRARLAVARASLDLAGANLQRLRDLPRAEDVAPLQAKVAEAEALLADARSRLELWESVRDQRAIARDELDRRRYAVTLAEAQLRGAEANLEAVRVGAWAPDLQVAQAEVDAAAAEVARVETELDRLIVRSPVDGEVLQVNVRAGEFAVAGATTTPLMLVGAVDVLHVHVDVDENDAWRVRGGAPARAFLRGNTSLSTPLTFVRFEPYVIPKRSLTGDSTERVDTRVLQVIYAFEPDSLPVYVGQLMDVYIEAPPVQAAEPTAPESASRPPAVARNTASAATSGGGVGRTAVRNWTWMGGGDA